MNLNYSLTQGGILIAVAGIFLVQFGFTDSCSTEIVAKVQPLLGALPGIAMAWFGRARQSDGTLSGFKKR